MKVKYKIILIVFLILLAYFLFNPFFFGFIQIILPRRIPDMEYARNYYSVISSVSGIILGILGIILGYFYFENRKAIDANTQKREQQCKRLDLFVSKLDKFDEDVHRILACDVSNDRELNWTRVNIVMYFEHIVSMLEEGYKLLGISREDAKKILKVNSFIDKNDLIMRHPLSELSKAELYPAKERYMELMRNARLICYRNII